MRSAAVSTEITRNDERYLGSFAYFAQLAENVKVQNSMTARTRRTTARVVQYLTRKTNRIRIRNSRIVPKLLRSPNNLRPRSIIPESPSFAVAGEN